MRVAVLGGTSGLGRALAIQLSRTGEHDVAVGSRDPERASKAADAYRDRIGDTVADPSLSGFQNPDAAQDADVVVLAVPAGAAADLADRIDDTLASSAVLVSPVVGISFGEAGPLYEPPTEGDSYAAVVDAAVSVPVVGAFHPVPASRFATGSLTCDVPLVGDEEAALERIASLVATIDGLSAIRAGPLAAAQSVERLAPLLIGIEMAGADEAPGLQFV